MQIAIVDDSRSMTEQLLRLFATNLPTVAVKSFSDPTAGLAWCKKNDVDLVLVDFEMPGMNGLQFIEALRELPSHADTLIIMLTTVSRKDVRYMALQLGANDFLPKPFDELELIIRVRNMLSLAESTRIRADRAVTAAKARFLSTMAHELRTPLNGMLGLALLLDQPNLNERQRDYLKLIENCGQTLTAKIANILTFANLTSGKSELRPEHVDMRAVAEEVAADLGQLASIKHLRLAIQIDPDLPDQIATDPQLVKRLITNLLDNAIKFTEAGEVVAGIAMGHSAAGGEQLEIVVRDTGIGMDMSQLRLFEPLTQKDETITRHYEGAGLGLAVVQEIVTHLGGKIVGKSAPGKGTQFRITLPATAVSPAVAKAG